MIIDRQIGELDNHKRREAWIHRATFSTAAEFRSHGSDSALQHNSTLIRPLISQFEMSREGEMPIAGQSQSLEKHPV